MSIFNMLSDMFFANDKKKNAVQEKNKPDKNMIVINEALQRIVPRIEREVPETGDFIPVVEKFRNLDSKLNVSEVRIEVERAFDFSKDADYDDAYYNEENNDEENNDEESDRLSLDLLYVHLKVDSASGMSTGSQFIMNIDTKKKTLFQN